MQRETPKSDVEKLILQAGGVKSLIGCLHGIAGIHKGKKKAFSSTEPLSSEKSERHVPIPDGLPKSQAELEEEEKGRMPDSPYTRLLRTKGKFPAWYNRDCEFFINFTTYICIERLRMYLFIDVGVFWTKMQL